MAPSSSDDADTPRHRSLRSIAHSRVSSPHNESESGKHHLERYAGIADASVLDLAADHVKLREKIQLWEPAVDRWDRMDAFEAEKTRLETKVHELDAKLTELDDAEVPEPRHGPVIGRTVAAAGGGIALAGGAVAAGLLAPVWIVPGLIAGGGTLTYRFIRGARNPGSNVHALWRAYTGAHTREHYHASKENTAKTQRKRESLTKEREDLTAEYVQANAKYYALRHEDDAAPPLTDVAIEQLTREQLHHEIRAELPRKCELLEGIEHEFIRRFLHIRDPWAEKARDLVTGSLIRKHPIASMHIIVALMAIREYDQSDSKKFVLEEPVNPDHVKLIRKWLDDCEESCRLMGIDPRDFLDTFISDDALASLDKDKLNFGQLRGEHLPDNVTRERSR